MLEIPTDLPAELVPLSWLIGTWEGSGVLDYVFGDEHVQQEFGQRVTFSPEPWSTLAYSANAWNLDDHAPLTSEMGYWRLARELVSADSGPGMLPAAGPGPFATADSVETLRQPHGGFDLSVSILHPDGINELYLGQIAGPRIDLATDAVLRSPGAHDYSAATRLYGLVEGHLLWAWDIAALGADLRTHASARLSKVS